MKSLTKPGNIKTGKHTLHFSLPAGSTCPNRTELCSKVCYIKNLVAMRPSVKESYDNNMEWISDNGLDSFINKINSELIGFRGDYRIHVSGDFYSVDYIYAWIKICESNPQVKFWGYTRSWRDAEKRKALKRLEKLSNVSLWASVDRETARPGRLVGWKRAYLSIDDSDVPKFKVDLVFRNNGSIKWKNPVIKIGGYQVCPLETGRKSYKGKVTCSTCRICL